MEVLATGELGSQPHAPAVNSDAKDDLRVEPDALFCDAIETQHLGLDTERPHAKVGATDDVAVDGEATPTTATPTAKLCHDYHAPNIEEVATVDVIVDHIPASMDDTKSNNKGSYDSIFTLIPVKRIAIWVNNIQSQNPVFFDLQLFQFHASLQTPLLLMTFVCKQMSRQLSPITQEDVPTVARNLESTMDTVDPGVDDQHTTDIADVSSIATPDSTIMDEEHLHDEDDEATVVALTPMSATSMAEAHKSLQIDTLVEALPRY